MSPERAPLSELSNEHLLELAKRAKVRGAIASDLLRAVSVELMQRHNIAVTDVSERLGISRPTLYAWAKSSWTPSAAGDVEDGAAYQPLTGWAEVDADYTRAELAALKAELAQAVAEYRKKSELLQVAASLVETGKQLRTLADELGSRTLPEEEGEQRP